MNNNITPLSILGDEILGYVTGKTVDFSYDEQGLLTAIVGCRSGKISSEIEFIYRGGRLLGAEVFSVGPALGPSSKSDDVCTSSFHVVERDYQVQEILSDRTIHRGKRIYQHEHLYRQYGYENGRLVTLIENQKKEPALRFEHDPQGRLTAIRGDRGYRLISYNERGQAKTDKEIYETKLLHHYVTEFAGNGHPVQRFAVDASGRYALACKYIFAEDVPDRIAADDLVTRYWFDATGRLRLAVRGNLDEERPMSRQIDLASLALKPAKYLLDFEGSLDLMMASPDGGCQLHILKLSERAPELIQFVHCEQDGRVTKVENCPAISFNQCCAVIKAQATENGFQYVVPTTIADFPENVSV